MTAHKQYRRKPATIKINGFAVPEPVRFNLKKGEIYYVSRLGVMQLYDQLVWDDDSYDSKALKLGVIHLTKESAIDHAKALLSFTEQKHD